MQQAWSARGAAAPPPPPLNTRLEGRQLEAKGAPGLVHQAGASVKGMIEPKDELPLSTFPALRERHPLPR